MNVELAIAAVLIFLLVSIAGIPFVIEAVLDSVADYKLRTKSLRRCPSCEKELK